MGRPHTLLQDPERVELFAQMVAEAKTRREIADVFGCDPSTVGEWKKLDAVQKAVTRFMRARANEVRAHTDTRILSLLRSGKELSVSQILAIRSEFTSDVGAEEGDSELVAKLMEAAAKDPVLAQRLQAVLAVDSS